MTDTKMDDAIARVIQSASRLGVEINVIEAQRWIHEMANEQSGGDIVVDVDSASSATARRCSIWTRRISSASGRSPRSSASRTARTSGPRWHCPARLPRAGSRPTRRTPTSSSASTSPRLRAKKRAASWARSSATRRCPRCPARPTACGRSSWAPGRRRHQGRQDQHAGSPISWTPSELVAGEIVVTAADGSVRTVKWEDAAQKPGWCKLDWVVADASRGQLANASNVLDPTWEDADGSIVPLDGFLDPYFQEVYLDKDSKPLFDRIVRDMSTDAVDEYVHQLEHEVWKYSVADENWGKVARRLYNIFRLTGRYTEAAYIRELFDEPTTALYQLVRADPHDQGRRDRGQPVRQEVMVAQTDQLIMSAINALEGPQEAQVVGLLLKLRDEVSGRRPVDRRRRWRSCAGDARSGQPLLPRATGGAAGDRGIPGQDRGAQRVTQ